MKAKPNKHELTRRRGLTSDSSRVIGGRIQNDLHDEITAIAVAEDISFSDALRRILRMGAETWREKHGQA